MYNLIEYNENYSQTFIGLWQYYRDQPALNNDGSVIDDTSFFFNVKINTEIWVPLKYPSNFWRTLEMPFINYEIKLVLTWSANR